MALITQSYLREKLERLCGSHSDLYLREFASAALANERKSERDSRVFDIFLSHATEDAILIKALRDELVEHGYSVYVDWIDDPQLDRTHVNRETAQILRSRMGQCRSLLFATSDAARKSVWMPWELGYLDHSTNSRVAIVPIVSDSEASGEFRGQEYLSLYPYLDKTGSSLYIHSSASKFVTFSSWITGSNPS